MKTEIHPTAIVEKGAQLGDGVTIGPYAFIGSRVVLGRGCRIHHHGTVDGFTEMGEDCEVYPYACIGLKTQDLKFKGGEPGLKIGRRNVFREFSTVHTATCDGDFTIVGNESFFLAYTHVAHDCIVGNRVIMSNYSVLAGHVVIGDHVVIGGHAGAHQFCRIGARAMLGGCSKLERDVPPFLIADGNPAVVRTFNQVGLRRAGFSSDQMERVKDAYRTLYKKGVHRKDGIEALRAHAEAESEEFQTFLRFIEGSQRGLAPGGGDE